MPFLDVLLQMAMDILDDEEDDSVAVVPFTKESLIHGGKTRNGRCRRIIQIMTNVGMPVFFVCFCIIYFSYAALIQLNSA